MTIDAFVNIYDRLMRAEEHLKSIKEELLVYYSSDLGNPRGEFDPQVPSLRVWGTATGPATRFHTLVGETMHDLRSALDHLAWQLVIENGGEPVEFQTTFPILKVRPTANRQGVHPLPNIIGGVSEAARAIIDEAQPYWMEEAFGAHPLWILHTLWNIDKHRHVAMRGSRLDGWALSLGTPKFTFGFKTVSFDEYGTLLAVVPDDPDMDVNAETTVRVVVHEPDPGIHAPLYEVLTEARTAVATVVTACEDTCL